MLLVRKKDGTVEAWNHDNIIIAINKAAERCGAYVYSEDAFKVAFKISELFKDGVVDTMSIHPEVIRVLDEMGFKDVAQAYQDYRDYKNTYAKSFERLRQDADAILLLGDKENANFDSSLVSTKGSLIKGSLTKELYKKFYLSKREKELTKRGDIYIHDMRDMILGCFNCCLFDIGTVLKGGFEMSNVHYTEPNSVLSALQVIGDITLCTTAQQFGGFTLAELDKVLLPYCKKTYHKNYNLYLNISKDVNTREANRYALKALREELLQGFQSLECKLNTIPCSRGDFAFTTISFGHWTSEFNKWEQSLIKMVGEAILEVRMKGHADKPVVFPKLVYLYDESQIKEDEYARDLFKLAIKCSSKCMYPDYLSVSGDPKHNAVAKVYLEDGAITSPMGCRAYLSQWKDPETGKNVTIGRCNIGAVSLNLPVIMEYCKQTYGYQWRHHFWAELRDRLEVIRNFLKKRYDVIRHSKASSNPMAYTQGGLYKGFLKPNDEVGDLVDYMTASFGITALNEACILWGDTSIAEGSLFATWVLEYINDIITDFKNKDGYLYALYGTPAESLCGTQAKQYAEYSGDTQFGDYFSNSFHCWVGEKLTPFEKQDKEYENFHLCNGGHIQYVRIDNPENLEALEAIITRGMNLGFYQGVNFDASHCNDCGADYANGGITCPHCGSNNVTTISRVCGYLGYSNVNGETRMNDAKMAELKDRVSM